MSTFEKIYSFIVKIPIGKISTYQQIAKLSKTDPRIVGFALHANKNPQQIPCHRVVNSKGKLSKGYAFGGMSKQKQILEKEGIEFTNETIDLKKFEYNFNSLLL